MLLDRLDYNVTGPDTAVLTPLAGWLSRLHLVRSKHCKQDPAVLAQLGLAHQHGRQDQGISNNNNKVY